MEKSKIIKISIALLVGVLAIVYYFSTKDENNYENILANDVIVENKIEEEKVEEKNIIKVYVTGEVNSAGVIELEEGDRIEDAIEGAGGITQNANLKDINLAYEVSDGEKIYIPNISEEITQENESVSENDERTVETQNSSGKVNINKATVSELTKVPGIGASTAQKIVSYRDENGKFKAIEDIKNVSGIGDSKYESMKDYISVK